jgi:hypothetical protein
MESSLLSADKAVAEATVTGYSGSWQASGRLMSHLAFYTRWPLAKNHHMLIDAISKPPFQPPN